MRKVFGCLCIGFLLLTASGLVNAAGQEDPLAAWRETLKKSQEDAALNPPKPPIVYEPAVHAKDVVLDGVTYSKFALIRDFLNVAFSTTLEHEALGTENDAQFGLFVKRLAEQPVPDEVAVLQSSSSWRRAWEYAQYAAFEGKYPKFGVINKWAKAKVYISAGWSDSEDDNERVVKEQVAKLAAPLKEISGVELVWLSAKEREKLPVDIQVVQAEGRGSFFKVDHWRALPLVQDGWKTTRHNYYSYWGAVRFTPFSRSSVDGFFLPDIQNNIDQATCFVVPAVGDDAIRALVTECLVRALGLSELSSVRSGTLLGDWNSVYDPYSQRPALGKDAASHNEDESSLPVLTAKDFKDVGQDFTRYAVLSEYDRQMLKLLYCPAIKQGMDKYAAIAALAMADECFGHD